MRNCCCVNELEIAARQDDIRFNCDSCRVSDVLTARTRGGLRRSDSSPGLKDERRRARRSVCSIGRTSCGCDTCSVDGVQVEVKDIVIDHASLVVGAVHEYLVASHSLSHERESDTSFFSFLRLSQISFYHCPEYPIGANSNFSKFRDIFYVKVNPRDTNTGDK
jgi:hypothetical protein